MVLALNISIDKEGSIVDIYDKIFTLDGGIYDRSINNKNFADKHRIAKIKEQIHQISRDIAIWMFENNSEMVYIPKEEYQKLCDDVVQKHDYKNENIQQDILIGNFFKLVKYCEGLETEKLYFVHRSIYEYFVAETIFTSIKNAMLVLTEKSQEEFAQRIVIYLKNGRITKTIGEYFCYKILTFYNKLSIAKKKYFYEWWENAVNKMMKKGMLYYINNIIWDYENVIGCEINCFGNLMKILKLLKTIDNTIYILKNADRDKLKKYINYYYIEWRNKGERVELNSISLSGMQLTQTNLKEADLSNVDLTNAILEEADLRRSVLLCSTLDHANLYGADLREADLKEANLSCTTFSHANLYEADLRKSKLYKTVFISSDLRKADLQEIDLRGAYLTASIWSKDDIQKILHQLKYTSFEYINVEDEKRIKCLYRNDVVCTSITRFN